MNAGMAGLAERQEIVEVTGACFVVPDRVDVVGVEAPALAADHAPIAVARVDARGLLTRPAADVGPFRRHSPLPEVRPLSTPRCPDDAEVLLRVHARPLERPSLAPLHQPSADPGQGLARLFAELQGGQAIQTWRVAQVVQRAGVLPRGKAEATVWTCDLSFDYVKINAEYRT